MGKCVKRATKPHSASIASRTRVEALRVEGLERAALLACDELDRARARERVQTGAVAEVHVAHEPQLLEHVEVAVDRREIRAGQTAGKRVGADRPVGRVQGLEHLPARGRHAHAAHPQRAER